MPKKIRVALIFGGKSAEHEVSLQSAKNVFDALDPKEFEVVLVGIDKYGRWVLQDSSKFLLDVSNPAQIKLNSSSREVAFVPDGSGDGVLVETGVGNVGDIDVVFPILHGPLGEDGTVQGLLKLLDVPFVGAGVLGSAIGMDKDVMKRLLRDARIPVAKFLVLRGACALSFSDVKRELGLPFFVKPVNMGSSVGVSKVLNKGEFGKAIALAFEYDTKVICEEFVDAREIECSVLGNTDPIASLPGEVVVHDEFYSYETKYISDTGSELVIPAKISKTLVKKIQMMAIKAFQILECSGMARVDFFLTKKGKVYLNEINTIPGFTRISMYPKMWEASGISYSELCSRLIELAFARHAREKRLKTDRG